MRDLAIPAIPTLYAGVLFRSRTEARWAFFWDVLGVRWEYEPQGFIAAGIPYLPDFAVFPALGTVFIEIKHGWQADAEGVAKWREFAMRRPQPSRAALIAGLPALHNKPLVIGGDDGADGPLKGPWEDDTQEWRPCPGAHHFDLACPGTFGARFAEDGCPGGSITTGEARIARASQAALSARFDGKDHGTAV